MKVILNGACGAMGQQLQKLLVDGGHSIAALVDTKGGKGIHQSFSKINDKADLIIDFSYHTATRAAVDHALSHKLPIVIGTTGHTEEERDYILEAAKQIPVFYSGNMSLGIAVLCRLTQEALRYFPDADVEILEIHHNRKADAPSGTALMLARAIQAQRPHATVRCGRSGLCRRTPQEIGISSIRLGNTVGIHEVMISTGTQTLHLKHEAHDRALFAQGAVEAAVFLAQQPRGLYGMEELLNQDGHSL